MTTDINRLLSRARLVPTAPYTLAEIEAAEERIAARFAGREVPGHDGPDLEVPGCAAPDREVPGSATTVGAGQTGRAGRDAARDPAARHLRTLCETFLMSPGALEPLREFLTSALPEPPGARVLGGILYLANCEDSARFWWQYAAGASDTVSSYCLYLHHRSLGEESEAGLWRDHTALTPATLSPESTELEIATALRLLAGLRRRRSLPDPLRVLIEYVPVMVGFVDEDLDLPLPDRGLPQAIGKIIDKGPAGTGSDPAAGQVPPQRRNPRPEAGPLERRQKRGPGWSREVRDALRDCAESVSC
ncbi:hypothetical protein OG533_32500 [Streptomyces sp. NBC_01186]|uniref:hypothetical protein n=1 Tax=Streptomyces sp. NBC_01186 TaxID=2903765 RepID=UPI002E0E525A|nr:hypothetical protein OG533_32500 [Streptomyces sp. NBC_01186]